MISPRERRLLLDFFLQGNEVIEVLLEDPIVAGLRRKGILRTISPERNGYIFGTFAFVSIDPRIRHLVTTEAIGLPGNPDDVSEET